eukprot:scaffold4562_cov178-Amphora_coffeaeformis.AAC.10
MLFCRSRWMFLVAVLLLGLSSVITQAQSTFNEGKFNSLIAKLESDVLEYARQIESFYATRCEDIQLGSCQEGNYDDCQSTYPDQQCLAGESYHIPVCGDSKDCSGLVDFSISTVRIPSDLVFGQYSNPTDPQVIETVCYTQKMDEWLQAKQAQDQEYWDDLGVAPWAFYFGSHTGVLRLWPARHAATCGDYDPRVRPWYVAASSGPKNVIMVLDTSGSMQGLRMNLLKEAAKRVVDTLTVSDRIAIVPFSSDAETPLTDEGGNMFIATQENKDILLEEIEKLEARGRTNFYDAFAKAFDVLDQSAREEITVNCNTAILFLTDGEMSEPPNISETDVLDLLRSRIAITNQLIPKPILLFTYSVSEDEQVHELPYKMACATEWGVWSKVTADANIVDSLSNYYRLFALGLGADKDSVAWVEPYEYDPGETLGTSVSVPVYDRTKDPPIFLGVASIDVSMAALDAALGITPGRGSEESINRVALVSASRGCPTLELGVCELESFRRQGSAGDVGMCSRNCTSGDYVQVEEEKCPIVSDYPTNLWKGVELAGVPYEERVCCVIGETVPSEQCLAKEDDGTASTSVMVGVILGGIGFLLCLGLCWWCMMPVDDDDENTVTASKSTPAPPIIVLPPASSETQTTTPPGGAAPPSTVTIDVPKLPQVKAEEGQKVNQLGD